MAENARKPWGAAARVLLESAFASGAVAISDEQLEAVLSKMSDKTDSVADTAADEFVKDYLTAFF